MLIVSLHLSEVPLHRFVKLSHLKIFGLVSLHE